MGRMKERGKRAGGRAGIVARAVPPAAKSGAAYKSCCTIGQALAQPRPQATSMGL